MRRIAVHRDVGDRGVRRGEPLAAVEVALHAAKKVLREADRLLIHRKVEQLRDARGRGPERERAGGRGQPALHLGLCAGVLGQPLPARVAREGEVHEDGVAVGDDGLAVLDHGHLPERVEREELRRAVRAAREVHVDEFVRHAEQRQHQLRAMGMAADRAKRCRRIGAGGADMAVSG